MKFETAIIRIRPRSILEIVDLAFKFYSAHLGQLGIPTLILGLPAVGMALYTLTLTGNVWIAALVYWLLLPLASGATIMAASRLVFGVHMSIKHTLALYRPLAAQHFMGRLLQRVIWLALLPFVVGELLRLKWGFTPMIVLLERLSKQQLVLRRSSLYRRSGTDAFGLDLAVMTLAAALVTALSFVFDLVFSDILSVWDFGGMFSELGTNPLKVGLWLLAILLICPIVDLAWFFFYLDTRIRKEGWDIELGFKSMAARLDKGMDEAA